LSSSAIQGAAVVGNGPMRGVSVRSSSRQAN